MSAQADIRRTAAVKAGAEIEQHYVVVRRLAMQRHENAFQRRRLDRREGARAGMASHDRETTFGLVQYRIGQRITASDDAAKVLLRCKSELNVDIGET